MVELEPGPNHTELREVFELRPWQVEHEAVHPVGSKGVDLGEAGLRRIDVHTLQGPDTSWGQSVAADLFTGENGLVDQEHIGAVPREVIRRGGASGPRTDAQDVGLDGAWRLFAPSSLGPEAGPAPPTCGFPSRAGLCETIHKLILLLRARGANRIGEPLLDADPGHLKPRSRPKRTEKSHANENQNTIQATNTGAMRPGDPVAPNTVRPMASPHTTPVTRTRMTLGLWNQRK
jgi:hypothetical protein